MQTLSYTFDGTGAAVYLCIGFIPDRVKIVAVGSANSPYVVWGREWRAAVSNNGMLVVQDAHTLYTKGNGVEPYEGGDLMTSTIQTSTDYLAHAGVYLGIDKQNYAKNDAYGYTDNPIDTWTLDTPGSLTGSFNEDTPASVSRIGPGSRILIEEDAGHKQKWAVIETLTAGQGEADDEVLLSRAIKSGQILYIGGRYDLAPIAIGKVTPKGIKLCATSTINTDNELQMLIASQMDN